MSSGTYGRDENYIYKENLKERCHLEELDTDRKIILEELDAFFFTVSPCISFH